MHKFFLLFLLTTTAASCNDKPEVVITSGNQLLYAFPNPTYNEVYVSVKNSSSAAWTLQFLDANGKIMEQETVPSGDQDFRFNLQDEPPGYYHMVLNTGTDKYTREVLKIAQ